MKKSTLFIICLLCIVFAELVMVFENGKQQVYALDSKVISMPVLEDENKVVETENKVVEPLLFEQHSANYVEALLDEFAADVTQSMAESEALPQPQTAAIKTTKENMSDKEPVLYMEEELAEIISEPKTTEENAKTESLPEPEKIKTEAVNSAQEITAEALKPAETKANAAKRAKIAIVIDDVGLSVPFTKAIAQVKAPLTVSFLPYGHSDKEQVETLENAGFEVMVHIPMMPHVPAALAPVTLSPEMDKAETQAELTKMLQRFEGTKMTGVNNHMGSLLTERIKNMQYVMEVLKKRGLYFLDSKTTGKSVAKEAAEKYGVAYIARDVFLDNEREYNYIMGQFRQTEKTALKKGAAVAIGHPYSQTLAVLKDWLKEIENKNIEIVHLSDLLETK